MLTVLSAPVSGWAEGGSWSVPSSELQRLEPIAQFAPLPAQPALLQSPASVQAAEMAEPRRLEPIDAAGAPALTADDLRRLEVTIQAQDQRLADQEKRLANQARALEEQRQALIAQQRALKAMQAQLYGGKPQVVPATMGGAGAASPPPQEPKVQKVPAQAETAPGTPPPVGEAPPAEAPERPQVAALAEVGGVLTPKGTIVFEPSLTVSHSNINRFVFQGVEIVQAVLVGAIEASDADRNSVSFSGGLRYGLTDRLEIEAKLPIIYRDDTVTNLVVSSGAQTSSDLDAFGIGDAEFAGHYQINQGAGGWPYFVGNLRVKTDTGKSPFDIDRNAQGIELELPTGSGFWGVQPSITAIFPSDPVVFYANLGYLWNIKRNIDEQIGTVLVGDVDPGDNISLSFGMGFGINERASFNLGYEHNYITETKTQINGVTTRSDALQVGLFDLGFSYRLSDMISVNLDFKVGATEDAPDAQATLRVPVALQLFD